MPVVSSWDGAVSPSETNKRDVVPLCLSNPERGSRSPDVEPKSFCYCHIS